MEPSSRPPSLLIRRAGPSDAAALARVGAETFTETFGHRYPREDLEAFLHENHSVDAHTRVLADPRYAAWLVEVDGAPVGHALAGPCALPHPEVGAADGELKRLYLRRSVQSGGQGGRLLREVLDWLERDGPRTLWVGVWSENHGAQRLYARHGFTRAGEYAFLVGRMRDHDFILRRGPSVALGTLRPG